MVEFRMGTNDAPEAISGAGFWIVVTCVCVISPGGISSVNTTSICGVAPAGFIEDNPPKASRIPELFTEFQTLAAARIWLITAWNESPGISAAGPWLEIRYVTVLFSSP